MSSRQPVFAQIMQFLDPKEFARCAAQFPSDRTPRGPSGYDQFLALCFAQLTYRQSLREVVLCLGSRPQRAYHLGFRHALTRSGLAYANQQRDWRIMAAVTQVLMRRAERLYRTAEPDAQLPILAFALDASLIELSVALFPFAQRQTQEASVKLHVLLSLRHPLPVWALLTDNRLPDLKALDQVPKLPGAFYVLDRGYLDFTRLWPLHQAGAFFVVRSKCHLRFRVLASRPVDKSIGLRCDQTIRLTTSWSRRRWFTPLRRVRVWDAETKRSLVFLTNNFTLAAEQIAALYRRRWQVELFFKWLKQHLQIRAFFGRSPNAVQTQIWSAIATYLLVAIAKKEFNLPQSLHQILQTVSVSAFEEIPLPELFTKHSTESSQNLNPIQLSFNDL
jgi:Transposase DDE domain/Domain of unknown function (DUF4372)